MNAQVCVGRPCCENSGTALTLAEQERMTTMGLVIILFAALMPLFIAVAVGVTTPTAQTRG